MVAAENRSNLSAYNDDSRRLYKIPLAFCVISLYPRLASVLGGDNAAYKLAIEGTIILCIWIF